MIFQQFIKTENKCREKKRGIILLVKTIITENHTKRNKSLYCKAVLVTGFFMVKI